MPSSLQPWCPLYCRVARTPSTNCAKKASEHNGHAISARSRRGPVGIIGFLLEINFSLASKVLRIHKQLKFEGFRRISKDFEGFYSISTASFVVWIDFSAHSYLETLQDRRLGFPKRPYF